MAADCLADGDLAFEDLADDDVRPRFPLAVADRLARQERLIGLYGDCGRYNIVDGRNGVDCFGLGRGFRHGASQPVRAYRAISPK